jgi:hypothetical protein
MNRLLTLGAAIVALVILTPVATGLINPKYTPVDLVRDSSAVLVLRATAPQDGRITAQVTQVLAGVAPAQKLTFDFNDAQDLSADKVTAAFGGQDSAAAVMCIGKRKEEGMVVAALEIGTTWMGLTQGDAKDLWKLDRDPKDLETVWGGSVRFLIPALRYTLTDPSPAFPVASTMDWGKDLSLGKLPGPAHGCLVTADGVIVLCEGGDRVFKPANADRPPADVTHSLNLSSKSRAMAAGDFNGDGRQDLASWDGAKLWLLLRGEDGKFTAPAGGYELSDCRSISSLGAGLIVGRSKGLTWFAPDATGKLIPRDLGGDGGPCAVADIDDDGAPDILQVSPESLSIRAGQRGAGFAAPVVTKVPTVKNPLSLVCGDFDTDGQLDLLVAGEGGWALLSRNERQWTNIMAQTGELGAASGMGQGETNAAWACLADVNGDGRQGVAFFHTSASPSLFFNRGFAAFGVARTLAFSESKAPAAAALGGGQTAGALADLNDDRVIDLLAVDRQRNVWVLYGQAKEPRDARLTLQATGAAPLTLSISFGARPLGIWVLRPGEPAAFALPEPGKAVLRWRKADGAASEQAVMVEGDTRSRL